MRKLTALFFVLTLWTGLAGSDAPRGSLLIIGGALDPHNDAVYQTFIHMGGGKESIRIAVIPAASGNPVKSGQSFVRDFVRYGVPQNRIKVFPLAVKDDASTPDIDESQWADNGKNKALADELRKYTAVFLVGGDQARYRTVLIDAEGRDLPMLAAIREIYHNGGVIGGTSAGAAIMSDPMIISGSASESINSGVVYQLSPSGPDPDKKTRLTKGFGLFTAGIIDQHFLKRGRTGRLIPTILFSRKQKKHTLGFGVDEDTAIIYRQNTVKVIGRSGMLIIDTTGAEIRETPHGPNAKNIVLHYLEQGDTFNTETGAFLINPERKKIEKGKEYYKTYPLDTNIFGKDAVKEILTAGLGDNRQSQSEGLSFTLEADGSGTGMRLIFSRGEETRAFYGKIDGRETFSVLHVSLDCFPISVRVQPLHSGQ